jgi:hypothetical protein
MVSVHAQRDVRLAAVAAEMTLADEQPNEHSDVEFVWISHAQPSAVVSP